MTSTSGPSGARLRLGARSLATPVLSALVLLVLVAGIDRLPAVDAYAPPAWTRRVPDFDFKYDRYRQLSRTDGSFDVVVVGSSLAVAGVNPDELVVGIGRRAGRRLRAFNFGLAGASNLVVDALIRILRSDPRPPGFYLYVTGDNALRPYFGEKLGKIVAEEPWFRHRAGEVDLEGWLLERWSGLRRWNGLSRGDAAWRTDEQLGPMGDRHLPSSPVRRGAKGVEEPELVRVEGDDTPWPANVDTLRESLEVIGPRHGTVAIAPVLPAGVRLAATAHAAAFEETTREAGIPLVPVPPEELLLPGHFRDAGHLDASGARVYSRWLGERLAELAAAGVIDLPATGPR